MKTLSKLLRLVGYAYFIVAILLLAASSTMIVLRDGFARLAEILSPFNSWNTLVVVLLLFPGYYLLTLATKLQSRPLASGPRTK